MTTPTTQNPSQCCPWFNESRFDAKQQRCVAQMTLLFISTITLALSIFLTLVCSGVLWETFPLYSLGEIAVYGSGIFLTLSTVSTLISLGLLLQQYCV